jgi:hypothetical protein
MSIFDSVLGSLKWIFLENWSGGVPLLKIVLNYEMIYKFW